MRQAGPRDWSPPEYDDYRPAYVCPPASGRSTKTFMPRRTSRNWPGWISLILGFIAAGLAVFPLTAAGVGNGFIASTVGISAIGYGVFALALRRRGDATARLSPIIGIILGIFGTVLMGSSVVNYYLQGGSFDAPSVFQVSGTEFPYQPPAQDPPALESAPIAAPAAFTSIDEERMALTQNLGTVHFVLNQIAPDSKPGSLSLATPGGTLSTPDGQALTILPAGTAVTYFISEDGSSYVITLQGAAFGSMVQLDSSLGQIVSLQ